MSSQELTEYRKRLRGDSTLDLYVPRRFTAATLEGGTEPDLDYFQWRGVLREREPGLDEILKHPRVVILGEPGAGKSLVAQVAVQKGLSNAERVPVFSELKQYRGDLGKLLRVAAPNSILDNNVLKRAYVLDGVDEIPPEYLAAFGRDLSDLLARDDGASALLTSRQAFYVTQRTLLPQFLAVFHILEFSDDDIRDYLDKKRADAEAFLQAVRLADASEEIRNPFALSVMVERFEQIGTLSSFRSENLSYLIGRMIQKRPVVNEHRQRRALCMLAVACETYCRNELTEQETLRIIKQSMLITDIEARQIISELHASILRRTANGIAFQMRSYGEYLAAESLQNERRVDRLKELAFLDCETPNESWVNTTSYLAEMNPIVRTFFVANYPFWMIHSSPPAFSDTEKTSIVRAILKQAANEDCYIFRHPRINLRSLGRFLTPAIEAEMLTNLTSSSDLVRGNAMVVLSLRHQSDVLPLALAVLKDRKLDVSLRKCAILAVTTTGGFDLVPDLMAFLDHDDPLYNEVLDCIGALCDESQISAVLPLLLTAGTILNASFYHFREFRSREALLQTLSYFGTRPHDLNVIRADGYLEPMLRLIGKYWDETTARQCVTIIKEIDEKKVYPDRSGIAYKLFRAVREADGSGFVARCFLEDTLNSGKAGERRWFYVDQLIADLSTMETAQWLIDNHATALIQQLSPYVQGTVRELLRSHSNGWIDTQDENAKAYAAERTEKENARKEEISLSQERLSQEQDFHKAINEFHELEESHWPELSTERKAWLATQVSQLLVALDLERSIVWKDETLTTPAVLSVLLKLVHRYELNVTPDTSLVYATVSWDEKIVAEYYRRSGLSSPALQILDSLLVNPKSPRALAGTVGFVRDSGIWSTSVQAGLMQVVRDRVENYYQVDALHLLAGHGVDADFLKEIADGGASSHLRTTAFGFLIERQHRPTIQGALSKLLSDESALRHGETGFPLETPLAWIAKIRSDFAIPRLADLRATALKLELPRVVGLISTTLSKIDRSQSAQIIKRQIPLAPVGWRQAQQFIAVEEDRAAKIETIQRSPFEVILARLKGATSIDRLKVWCEGPTDIPVFKSLLAQVPNTPEILFDFVGGWPNLQAKDPQSFQHGCKEAIVVMDGDLGRRLDKPTKPPTKIAKDQQRRFTGLPVELYVLERYGIENYFPQSSIEVVVGQSLGRYFPIPHHLSVIEYLRDSRGQSPWERVKRHLAWRYGLRFKFAGQKLYNKNLNQKVSELLALDRDLSGTDLGDIIHRIADRAEALAKDS